MDSSDGQVPVLGEDDEDLKAGDAVGEYIVDKKIGEGGFGTVFRAVHPIIGKEVAIKVLARQFSSQREMVSRFVNEARAVIQIQHRHIIDIFAFGQLEDGRHYYVMELLNGRPLDAHLDEVGAVPMDDAIGILRAVAKALDAAHRKGIAHRDLKPENVFLATEDDEIFPKLLDFGIAKLLGGGMQEHKTATGAPIGTPLYMSPEQCRGKDVDHRTDIYAFGILTYQMLTGEMPFDGDDYMDILFKQIGEQPPKPSSIISELPAAVDETILWMMAKERDKRPPNLLTAVRALEDAASEAGFNVPAGPTPTGEFSAQTRLPSQSSLPALEGKPSTVAPTVIGSKSVDTTTDELPAISGSGTQGKLIVGGALLAIVAGAAFFVLSGDAEKKTSAAKQEAPVQSVTDIPVVETPDPPEPPPKQEPVAPISVTIEGPPEGTEVYGPRGILGVAPGKIQLDPGEQSIMLTFKADGFQTATRELAPSKDLTIEVQLVAKPKVKTKKKNKKKKRRDDRHQIENPF